MTPEGKKIIEWMRTDPLCEHGFFIVPNGNDTQREIAAICGELEKDGYVSIKKDQHQRRCVRITEKAGPILFTPIPETREAAYYRTFGRKESQTPEQETLIEI